jgi:hypothetical protein
MALIKFFLRMVFGGLVSRFRKPGPAWSRMTQKEYEKMVNLIIGYFAKQGVEAEVSDNVVLLSEEDEAKFGKIGLTNVCQILRQVPQENWEEVIEQFMGSMATIHEQLDQIQELEKNFETIKSYLAVRLQPKGYIDEVNEMTRGEGQDPICYREEFEGIYSTLVYDLPQQVMSVSMDKLEVWGVDYETAFQAGMDNLREKDVSELVPVRENEEDEVGFYVLANKDEPYAATRVLSLKDFPEVIGSFGTVFGLPTRNEVLCYPVNDIRVLGRIQVMMPPILGLYDQGPGSISSQLYWYWKGAFQLLPYDIDDRKIDFKFPEEFKSIVRQLQES